MTEEGRRAKNKRYGEPFGWLTNLSTYVAKMNTELEKTKDENAKLRTFAARLVRQLFDYTQNPVTRGVICDEARELGIDLME